jgi:hypothetical protein
VTPTVAGQDGQSEKWLRDPKVEPQDPDLAEHLRLAVESAKGKSLHYVIQSGWLIGSRMVGQVWREPETFFISHHPDAGSRHQFERSRFS